MTWRGPHAEDGSAQAHLVSLQGSGLLGAESRQAGSGPSDSSSYGIISRVMPSLLASDYTARTLTIGLSLVSGTSYTPNTSWIISLNPPHSSLAACQAVCC